MGEMDWETAKGVVMPFGKHKGQTFEDIANDDVLYLDWLIGQDWLRGDLKECVQAACDEFAGEIDRRVR
jgi:uncharacterized protein (DUF3820 family)